MKVSPSTSGILRGPANRSPTTGRSARSWGSRSTAAITSGSCTAPAAPWQAGRLAGWQEECCVPAPAVIEFDQQGNVVQGWGGPPADEMPRPAALPWQPPRDHTWVQSEHNIFVDHEDNVWLGNYSGSHILKMRRDGELLLEIGQPLAQGQDSNDTHAFGSPTGRTSGFRCSARTGRS